MGSSKSGNRKPTVAVFGDTMMDLYWFGVANRLSAEAPIPIVAITETLPLPGGAGNVVANLKALNVTVIDCTTPGPVKHRLMVGDRQIARWDVNDHCPSWEGEMPQADAYIISDYNKGGLPRNVQWPRPLFVDTKKPPHCFPEDAIFFPNEKEFEQYEEEYNVLPCVVRKQGAKGISLLKCGNVIYHTPTEAKFVNSVNGAGDTVLAAFVANYLDHWPMEASVLFASFAAGIVVEKPLTSVVTREEISRRMKNV